MDIILTCHKCGNRYQVSQAELSNDRLVKCMSCNNQWLYKASEKSKEFQTDAAAEESCLMWHRDADGAANEDEEKVEIVKINKQEKKPSKLANPLKKTISLFMILSIAGNVVFWVCYFMQFSCDWRYYLAPVLKFFK